MLKLKIIIVSTRPGRVGPTIAEWFIEEAKKNGKFEIEVLDLAKINLPFLDEPNHPAQQKYTHQHTKDWATKIIDGDAYIVVTPEYNFGMPATLKNAFDFVYKEWNYKPIGFVSYGGLSGGTRSVQHAKEIATTLKMMPMYEAVNIPFVGQQIKDGKFQNNEKNDASVQTLLNELARWAEALKLMRLG